MKQYYAMDNTGALTQNDTSIELQRHIRQNNDRLRCIQKHLQNTQGFQQAAKELLEWCSDARAFQKAFEESLMGCLTVISEVASKPGFDLSLGYRLLAICAAHKHKFSVKSSNLLQCWSNELGNSLLIQQQKLRPNEDGKQGLSPGPHIGGMGNNYNPPPPLAQQQRYPNQNWNNGPRGMGPNPGSTMAPRPQQSAVSVITTVWGLSNTQQSQQMTQNAMSGNNHYQSHSMAHMGGGNSGRHHNDDAGYPHPMNNFNGPHHNKMNSFGPKNDPYQRQDSYGGAGGGMTHKPMNGMSYGPNKGMPSHHMGQDTGDYAQPAAAAAAAAVAAAAATATATATATLIANDQQQQQHQQQQNDMNSYDSMMNQNLSGSYGMQPGPPNDMHRPLHAVHGGGGQHSMGGMDMRNNYNQHLPMTRGHSRPNIPPDYNHSRPPMGPNPGMNRNGGYPSIPQPQQQFRGPFRPRQVSYQQYNGSSNGVDFKSPNGAPPSTGYSPRTPMGTSTGSMHPVGDMYPNSSSAPPGSFFSPNHLQPNNIGNQNFTRPPFGGSQYQPYRGNANQSSGMTSPINPGNVPPYPGPDMKPMIPPNQLDIKPTLPICGESMGGGPMNDIKPTPGQLQRSLMNDNDDLRLTFPVRDGIVLHPFRLEHNLPHSSHMFQLKPKVYETLRWRPDLELQFKCYHHENRLSTTNWPHSVQVGVNDTMLPIPRTPVNRPLYLKNVCKEGKNIINIGVQTCCCSHLFVLQLVHRPTVQSVIKGLLQKRLLPVQHCITKIRRLFQNGIVGGMGSPMSNNMMGEGNNSIKISLLCPITMRRIELPARGHDCKHIQCFDLSSYLQVNCDKGSWTCPVCKKSALLEGLEVDQYTWTILKHMQDGSGSEVTIDSNCTWRPIHIKQEIIVKEEPDAPPSKRFKSGMSPSTMLNHLPSPGSYVPMMTPLPPNKRQPSLDGTGFPGNNSGSYSGCGMSALHGGGANSMMQNRHQPINKTLSLSELNDNIAANDKRQIERRINPAMSGGMIQSPIMRNPNTPHPHTPGTPMRPPSHPSGQMSHNNSSGSHPSMPLTPNTSNSNMCVKPPTPGVGMSPSVAHKRQDCNDNALNDLLQQPTSKSNNNSLNFDAELVINGDALCDNSDVIPSLDILPENTDPMEILNFLEPPDDGSVPTTSADDLLTNLGL